MDILYLLIPLSLILVLLIGIAIWWSVESGQFDNLESEGMRIFDAEPPADPAPTLHSDPDHEKAQVP